MNQKVQEFINQQKIQLENNKNMEKAKVLNDLGLYDKEYSENSAWSEKYPEYEYDQVTQQGKYFRKIPISVTDEEYAEILKYSNIDNTQIESDDVKTNSNTIATIFSVIAVFIFILGLFLGIVLGDAIGYKFSIGVALICWGSGFVGGMLMLGFAEIIKLLTAIKNK
mgnify:FL=1